jgi:hypothetical protein
MTGRICRNAREAALHLTSHRPRRPAELDIAATPTVSPSATRPIRFTTRAASVEAASASAATATAVANLLDIDGSVLQSIRENEPRQAVHIGA